MKNICNKWGSDCPLPAHYEHNGLYNIELVQRINGDPTFIGPCLKCKKLMSFKAINPVWECKRCIKEEEE